MTDFLNWYNGFVCISYLNPYLYYIYLFAYVESHMHIGRKDQKYIWNNSDIQFN